MLNKTVFQQAVSEMAQNPSDKAVQTRYFKQVLHLSEIIAKSYRVHEVDDMIQELAQYSITKKLHERIKPGHDPFSYYWKSLANHVWWLKKQQAEERVRTYDMWENSYSDEGESEEQMLRKLSFDLEEYSNGGVETIEEAIDAADTIVATRGKRGRPRIRDEGEKAAHWEYLFKQLKNKKTMTEKALINQLPTDKQTTLKNLTKSIEFYMRQIARRESVTLSVSKTGTETIYMIVE